jgi:hypothetical protein
MSSARKDCSRELAQTAGGGSHRVQYAAKISDPGTTGSRPKFNQEFLPHPKFYDALHAGRVDVLEKEASDLGKTGEWAGEHYRITKAHKTVIVEGDWKFASRSEQQADVCFDHQQRRYGKTDARE